VSSGEDFNQSFLSAVKAPETEPEPTPVVQSAEEAVAPGMQHHFVISDELSKS